MLLVSLLMLSFRKVGETMCAHQEEDQSLMDNCGTVNQRVKDSLPLVGDDPQAWFSMSFSGGAFRVQNSGWDFEYRKH